MALRDSPVGLAAYILEKFITWSNSDWKNLDDGGLTKKFTYTDLLDNVMLYWVTRSITTSLRIYSETLNKATSSLGLDMYVYCYNFSNILLLIFFLFSRLPIEVPSGCVRFKHEIIKQPDVILKEKFLNLIHSSDYNNGQFAAFEAPQLLAKDFFQFVEKVENMKKKLKTEL